jgi:transcriptional repressor NrdR
MRCPFCQTRDSRVIDSREQSNGGVIRRRRECVACGRRFTTYERYESNALMVVKKDGRREEFSHQKLHQKLRVALTKRPVSEAEVEALISRVEAELLATGAAEVPSAQIGDLVLRELKQLDDVAYIRFASVYRSFADLEDLRREVEELRREPDGALAMPKAARRRSRVRVPRRGVRPQHSLVMTE